MIRVGSRVRWTASVASPHPFCVRHAGSCLHSDTNNPAWSAEVLSTKTAPLPAHTKTAKGSYRLLKPMADGTTAESGRNPRGPESVVVDRSQPRVPSVALGRNKRALIFSLLGGLGILGSSLYFLSQNLGFGGHQATARFLLYPHVVTGSSVLMGSVLMFAKPSRTRDAGLVIAISSSASAVLVLVTPLILPILAAAVIAYIGGWTAYDKGG